MWTASVIDCVKNKDGETVTITGQNTDGVTVKPLGPWKLSASDEDTLSLSIIRLLRDAENFENRHDATVATAASFDVSAVTGKTSSDLQQAYDAAHPSPVQTQDQLDLQAFQQSVQSVISINNALVAATAAKVPTKLTQQDLDDARVAWKIALSVDPDKFLPLVPKDFPY